MPELYSIDKENKTRNHYPKRQKKEQKQSTVLVKIMVGIKVKHAL